MQSASDTVGLDLRPQRLCSWKISEKMDILRLVGRSAVQSQGRSLLRRKVISTAGWGYHKLIPTLRFIMTFLPCVQFIRPTAAHQYLLSLLSMRDSKWLRWIFYPHCGHQKAGRMSPSGCGRKSVAAHANICYPTAGAPAIAFLLYLLP